MIDAVINVFYSGQNLFWIVNPADILNLKNKFRIEGWVYHFNTDVNQLGFLFRLDLEEVLLGIEFGFVKLKRLFVRSELARFSFFSKCWFSKYQTKKTKKPTFKSFHVHKWRENLLVILKSIKLQAQNKQILVRNRKKSSYEKKNQLFNNKKLHNIFPRMCLNRFIDFVVFRDLWQRGFVMTNGLKFGSTYTAYSGNIKFFHSCASVFVVNYFSSFYSIDLVSFGRVGTSTKKRTVVAFISKNLLVNYFGIKWVNELP